jgi:hypothetical protein
MREIPREISIKNELANNAVTEADLLEILERDDLTKAERSKWRTELKRIREELRRGHERQQEQVQRDREHRRDGGWAVE